MKKIFVVILVLIIIFALSVTVYADDIVTQAKSYILIDAASGEVLLENNADEQFECASIIKAMSLLLFFEAEQSGRLSLSDTVTISQHASSMGGTQVFLDIGTEHTVQNLLKATVVCSANDASVALAEKIAGSEESFVQMMNKKANVLGLSANFVNASGLSVAGQTMSARDISIICRQLSQYDLFYTWSGIWMENYIHPDGRETEMVNSNRLVRFYEGADGFCTGSSASAGYGIAATVKRSGGRYIYVSLGSPNSSARFDEASSAFDYAFAGFSGKTIVREGQQLGKNLKIIGGTKSFVNVYAGAEFSALIEKGKENLVEKELVLLDEITAPLAEGEVIGYLRILLEGEEIGRVDAIVKQKVEALSFANSFKRILTWWLFS